MTLLVAMTLAATLAQPAQTTKRIYWKEGETILVGNRVYLKLSDDNHHGAARIRMGEKKIDLLPGEILSIGDIRVRCIATNLKGEHVIVEVSYGRAAAPNVPPRPADPQAPPPRPETDRPQDSQPPPPDAVGPAEALNRLNVRPRDESAPQQPAAAAPIMEGLLPFSNDIYFLSDSLLLDANALTLRESTTKSNNVAGRMDVPGPGAARLSLVFNGKDRDTIRLGAAATGASRQFAIRIGNPNQQAALYVSLRCGGEKDFRESAPKKIEPGHAEVLTLTTDAPFQEVGLTVVVDVNEAGHLKPGDTVLVDCLPYFAVPQSLLAAEDALLRGRYEAQAFSRFASEQNEVPLHLLQRWHVVMGLYAANLSTSGPDADRFKTLASEHFAQAGMDKAQAKRILPASWSDAVESLFDAAVTRKP